MGFALDDDEHARLRIDRIPLPDYHLALLIPPLREGAREVRLLGLAEVGHEGQGLGERGVGLAEAGGV